MGIGLNKAIYNLRNYGVDTEIIDTCLEELDDDEEYQAAMLLINNYTKETARFLIVTFKEKLKKNYF